MQLIVVEPCWWMRSCEPAQCGIVESCNESKRSRWSVFERRVLKPRLHCLQQREQLRPLPSRHSFSLHVAGPGNYSINGARQSPFVGQ